MYIFLKNVVSNRLLSLITIDTFFEWFFTAIGFPLQFFYFFLYHLYFSVRVYSKNCFGHLRLILKNFQNVIYEIFWKKGGKCGMAIEMRCLSFWYWAILFIFGESERESECIYTWSNSVLHHSLPFSFFVKIEIHIGQFEYWFSFPWAECGRTMRNGSVRTWWQRWDSNPRLRGDWWLKPFGC